MQQKLTIRYRRSFYIILAILVLAILATYPAFTGHYFTINNDGDIHLARLESIYRAFKNGHLPSLVNFIGLGHRGVAMNAMYPWITTLIFVIPRFIFQSPMLGLAAGFTIMNIITITNTYWLAKRLSSNRLVIWLGVIAYEFNSYHFQLMFTRVALGEAFGYAFLPLIALGLMKIWSREKNGILILALGMSLVGNSHVLSLAIFSLFILAFEIIRLLTRKLTWSEVRAILVAAGITLLLMAYSLYNIAVWLLHNKMVSPTPTLIGLDPWNGLTHLFSNNIAESATGPHMGIAMTFILIVLLAQLLSHPSGKWQPWIMGAASIWVLAQNWIPWYQLINTPASVFQFTMRFLTLVALCLTVGFILYLDSRNWTSRPVSFFIGALIILIGLTGLNTYHQQTQLDYLWTKTQKYPTGETKNVVHKRQLRRLTGGNYQANFNAMVPGDYHLKNTQHPQPVPLQDANNLAWVSRDNRKTMAFDIPLATRFKFIKATDQAATFTFNQKKRTKVKLPVVGYHNVNYEVFVNNHRVPYTRTQGQLKVQLPAGKSTIMVSVANSARHGGLLLISAISYLICIGILILAFYQSHSKTVRTLKNSNS